MNARPTLQFKMRLAGHLGKTLAEIDQMDSREFSRWLAFSRWFSPLADSWTQTGMLASAMLAPYCPRGKVPSASDFIPIEDKAPKHPNQIREVLEQMKQDLEG
jgi:hypothetical protein